MSGAVTATVATVAALSTAEVFTAVAVAGAVIGAVGAVTGIKPLQYAGMALGVVGGVGALAVSAGVIGGGALADAGGLASDGGFAGAVGSDVAAGGGAAVSAQEQALVDAGLDVGTQSSGISSLVMAGTSASNADIVDSISGAVTPPDAVPTAATANAASPDVAPEAATDTAPVDASGQPIAQGDTEGGTLGTQNNPAATQSDPLASSTTVSAPAAPAAPGTAAANAQTGNILQGGQGLTTGAVAPSAPATGANASGLSSDVTNFGAVNTTQAGGAAQSLAENPSAFGSIMKTISTPGVGTLAAATIQAGAAFIAGATSKLTPAQVAALQAQANANQAAANLSTQQLQNMQGGIPTASRTPGLVNATPKPATVTGAPA